MKVKELLSVLPINQETQIHYSDFGYMSSYPGGFIHMDRVLEANITRIETDYIHQCSCTVVKIYSDLEQLKI